MRFIETNKSTNPSHVRMALNLGPALMRQVIRNGSTRSLHYKFKRTRTPPLQEPRESPYIVGPYLKPDYKTVEYITEPIKHYDENDIDHFIYEPTVVQNDEDRRVRLLLLEDVEGLGTSGQVVDAPYRYGASRLIAMKKADYFTEFTRSWYKFGPRTFESASSALSPITARKLRVTLFELPAKKGTVVQPWHLSLALRLAGCICPIDAIEPSSITEYVDDEESDCVKCTVRINNHEKVEVKFIFSKTEDNEGESFDLG